MTTETDVPQATAPQAMASPPIGDGDRVEVLDHGFVRLDASMADDLSVANAARVSFARRKDEMDDSDLVNNPIFGTADGDFGIQPELDARLAVLPLDDGLLMVAVLAAADDLDAAWQQAQAILGTARLER